MGGSLKNTVIYASVLAAVLGMAIIYASLKTDTPDNAPVEMSLPRAEAPTPAANESAPSATANHTSFTDIAVSVPMTQANDLISKKLPTKDKLMRASYERRRQVAVSQGRLAEFEKQEAAREKREAVNEERRERRRAEREKKMAEREREWAEHRERLEGRMTGERRKPMARGRTRNGEERL